MPDLRGRSVLVTGANGFIGAHVVAELTRLGAHVTGMVRSGSDLSRFDRLGLKPKLVVTDVRDHPEVARHVARIRPEYVFHLAVNRKKGDWQTAIDVNVKAAIHLMQAAKSSGLARFVSIGTSLEVPREPTMLPADLHGASRACGLLASQCLAQQEDIPFTALRTYYVYGILQGAEKLIPVAIRAGFEGSEMPITASGVLKRLVNVDDVVRGCILALSCEPSAKCVYEMASPDQVSIDSLVARIAELMGKPIRTVAGEFARRAWDRQDWEIGGPNCLPLPNWEPQVDLDDGLRACIAQMQACHA